MISKENINALIFLPFLLTNSLKEMFADESGEFVCRY